MMPLSEHIAKLEQRLNKRLKRWKAKHSADWRLYAVLGGMGWYFYGMIVNSVRLGIRQSMDANSNIASIWVVNPIPQLDRTVHPDRTWHYSRTARSGVSADEERL